MYEPLKSRSTRSLSTSAPFRIVWAARVKGAFRSAEKKDPFLEDEGSWSEEALKRKQFTEAGGRVMLVRASIRVTSRK